jgi:hypothetical protein
MGGMEDDAKYVWLQAAVAWTYCGSRDFVRWVEESGIWPLEVALAAYNERTPQRLTPLVGSASDAWHILRWKIRDKQIPVYGIDRYWEPSRRDREAISDPFSPNPTPGRNHEIITRLGHLELDANSPILEGGSVPLLKSGSGRQGFVKSAIHPRKPGGWQLVLIEIEPAGLFSLIPGLGQIVCATEPNSVADTLSLRALEALESLAKVPDTRTNRIITRAIMHEFPKGDWADYTRKERLAKINGWVRANIEGVGDTKAKVSASSVDRYFGHL